jgi:DNA/RNA-binding domain of Phe-tRNA-synthetase-like protein
MATESDMKTSILLEATADEKQVQQEANKVADTAQKTLSKKDLQIQYKENLKELKAKLAETRVAYENMLRVAKTNADFKALEQMELQMQDIKNQIKETETALSDMGATN